jgi:hypothetical protein
MPILAWLQGCPQSRPAALSFNPAQIAKEPGLQSAEFSYRMPFQFCVDSRYVAIRGRGHEHVNQPLVRSLRGGSTARRVRATGLVWLPRALPLETFSF